MSEHRPELSRLPFRALGAVARVIASGDAKYAPGDWITAPGRVDGRRDLDSALGHIGEWLDGKDVDEESGQSPLAHAAARLLFILEREARGTRAGDWRVEVDRRVREIALAEAEFVRFAAPEPQEVD